jgi:hypothetical protein
MARSLIKQLQNTVQETRERAVRQLPWPGQPQANKERNRAANKSQAAGPLPRANRRDGGATCTSGRFACASRVAACMWRLVSLAASSKDAHEGYRTGFQAGRSQNVRVPMELHIERRATKPTISNS